MSKAILALLFLGVLSLAYQVPSYSSMKDCAQASLLLVHAIQQFQADLKNGTYSTYQLSQEVVTIISDMQSFFDKCNIPYTDAITLPTYSDPAQCLSDMATLSQISAALLVDLKDRNQQQIVADAFTMYKQALQTQSDCQGQLQQQQQEQIPEISLKLQQQQQPSQKINVTHDHLWDVKLPFDYNGCINAAEKYYNMLLHYQQTLKSGQDILIINETFKVWDYVYTLLPTCGLEKVEDIISEQAPQKCEVNLYTAFNYGYNCYQVKNQPVKYAKCMPKATYLWAVAKSSCPFLNNNTQSQNQTNLGSVNFEDLQNFAEQDFEKIKEKILAKFNFTQCWQQITFLGDDLTNWATAAQANNTFQFINATQAFADQIYSVLPACGLQNVEDQLNKVIPETCVNNLAAAATKGYSCYLIKSQTFKFASCMAQETILMNKAKISCPFLNNSTNTTTN